MTRKNLIALEYAAIALLSLVFVLMLARTYLLWSSGGGASEFAKIRAKDNPAATRRAAERLLQKASGSQELPFIIARAKLDARQFDAAANDYEKIASRALASDYRAAALVGQATVLLSKAVPPQRSDVDAALKLLVKADSIKPLADVYVMTAIAKLWAGDEEGARSAAEKAANLPRAPGADCMLALHMTQAHLAAKAGETGVAVASLRKASLLISDPDSRVAGMVSAAAAEVGQESALLPGADAAARKDVLKALKAHTAETLAGEKEYRFFLGAAVKLALSDSRNDMTTGVELLRTAAAARPDDPIPAIVATTLRMKELERLWEGAVKDGSKAASPWENLEVSVLDQLPGSSSKSKSSNKSIKANRGLDRLVAKEESVMSGFREIASMKVKGNDADVAEAFGIVKRLFEWKMRHVELATKVETQAIHKRASAEIVLWARELFGDKWPKTKDAALMLRNCGVLLAGSGEETLARGCLKESLEIDDSQKDIAESLGGPGLLEVVSTWPQQRKVRHRSALMGAEFRLSRRIASLKDCDVDARFGPKGGEKVKVEPAVQGTGVWYLPSTEQLVSGELELTIVVKHDSGLEASATSSITIDRSPPRIVLTEPDPESAVSDRTPLISFTWHDQMGVNPDSLQVTFEPVKASYIKQVLIADGKHARSRISGAVKWRAKTPAITGADAVSGKVTTGLASEVPVGTYRIRVVLADNLGQSAEETWTITIQ